MFNNYPAASDSPFVVVSDLCDSSCCWPSGRQQREELKNDKHLCLFLAAHKIISPCSCRKAINFSCSAPATLASAKAKAAAPAANCRRRGDPKPEPEPEPRLAAANSVKCKQGASDRLTGCLRAPSHPISSPFRLRYGGGGVYLWPYYASQSAGGSSFRASENERTENYFRVLFVCRRREQTSAASQSVSPPVGRLGDVIDPATEPKPLFALGCKKLSCRRCHHSAVPLAASCMI